MHSTGGPGWRITIDSSGALVLALYVRDAAGLQGAGDPAVSPAAPRVHSVVAHSNDSELDELRTEWEWWWRQLIQEHPAAITTFDPPGFKAFAGSPRLRSFCRAHFGAALTWGRERRAEYRRLEAERYAAGEPRILRQLVEDRQLELGRNAHSFRLSLTELPLSEPRAWFVEPDRVILSRQLLADAGHARSYLQPVIELLV